MQILFGKYRPQLFCLLLLSNAVDLFSKFREIKNVTKNSFRGQAVSIFHDI